MYFKAYACYILLRGPIRLGHDTYIHKTVLVDVTKRIMQLLIAEAGNRGYQRMTENLEGREKEREGEKERGGGERKREKGWVCTIVCIDS